MRPELSGMRELAFPTLSRKSRPPTPASGRGFNSIYVASRKDQKEKLRAERMAREAEEQTKDRRRRLVQYGSAAAFLAVCIVAVLIIVSQSGGGGGSPSDVSQADVAQV